MLQEQNLVVAICATGRRRATALGAAALAAAVLSSAAQAASECEQPPMPDMPNGAEAGLDDMLAGQQAVKAFQSANMDYMKCLEAAFAAAEAEAKAAPDAAEKAAALSDYQEAVDAYNKAVSSEEEVAGQFNIELREYRAASK